MTRNLISTIHPHRVNAGGIFIAIAKSAIQPLSCFILVPLALLIPGLASSIYYHVFSKQNFKITNFKSGFSKSIHIKAIVLSEIVYLSCMYFLFDFMSGKIHTYLEIYKHKASLNKVIQIATPEQIEYSRNLTQLFSACGWVLFALLILISGYIFLTNHVKENHIQDLSLVKQLKADIKAMFINFDLYVFVYIGLCVAIYVVETYFAQYKLLFIEAKVLNQDAFDPMIPFILIRLFLLHVSLYCINVLVYCSLNFIDKLYLKQQTLIDR